MQYIIFSLLHLSLSYYEMSLLQCSSSAMTINLLVTHYNTVEIAKTDILCLYFILVWCFYFCRIQNFVLLPWFLQYNIRIFVKQSTFSAFLYRIRTRLSMVHTIFVHIFNDEGDRISVLIKLFSFHKRQKFLN